MIIMAFNQDQTSDTDLVNLVEEKCNAYLESARRNRFDPDKIRKCYTDLGVLENLIRNGDISNGRVKNKLVEYAHAVMLAVNYIGKVGEDVKKVFDLIVTKRRGLENLQVYIQATQGLDTIPEIPYWRDWIRRHKTFRKSVQELLNFLRSYQAILQSDDVGPFYSQLKVLYYGPNNQIQIFKNALANILSTFQAADAIGQPTPPALPPTPVPPEYRILTDAQQTFDDKVKHEGLGQIISDLIQLLDIFIHTANKFKQYL
jgi:hypothetical protein